VTAKKVQVGSRERGGAEKPRPVRHVGFDPACMCFGIGMNTDHTLEEVGQQLSVIRERIRQIEAKMLMKLENPEQVEENAFRPRSVDKPQ
jgi:hypothetical protein